ncbi:MAG: sugar O-acetyltransferase [Tannerella sp.]|jgi:maltose O-acetyltransferase|nr:sugar O-acetyltransferase [Tannerella sp.]
MKTEKEKMLAGEVYNPGDPELSEQWHLAQKLIKEYNAADTTDRAGMISILDRLLGAHGKNTLIAQPFAVDYGNNISLGDDCEINCHCVFLDCNWITLGNNVLIAPGVHIYAVFHPLKASERFAKDENGTILFCKNLTAPVTIGNDVWIGGGSIIFPGVTIGNNVTIGAGSIVTHDIPDNVLAFGNPCRVVRELL